MQGAIKDRRQPAHSRGRTWPVCLGLWLITALASSALANEPEKRIAVLTFEGAGAATIRAHVVSALRDHEELTVVPVREVESAAKRLGVSLENSEGLVRVAEELEISAYVGGSLARVGGAFRAKVFVTNGSTGEVVHEEPWRRKNRGQLKAIESNFWKVMGPHIADTAAPAKTDAEPKHTEVRPKHEPRHELPPAPAQLPAPKDEESKSPPAEEPDAEGSKRPALIVSIGPRLLRRELQFYEPETGDLRGYTTKGALAVAGAIQWYPGAHARGDWLANVGLDLDADYTVGLKSETGGKSLATTAYELGAGLIVRIPLDLFEPRVRLGYVHHVFEVPTESTVLLPSMTYRSVRLGIGTALKIVEALSLDVGVAYLFVLDAGDLTSERYFPKAQVHGFEAGAGASVSIWGPLSLRGAVDFRRYLADLKAETSRAGQKLADRVTDDYLRFSLSLVCSLGRSGE